MSSKKARHKLAKFLSQHLSSFGKGFDDHLLCPTCMIRLHANNDSHIYTVGHIVPESSGGIDWTLLCKCCNSKFGEKQDKWFGEYLVVLNNPKGTFIHAKTKSKYISVNGVQVSGKVSISEEDDSIEVFLPINRNPPGKVESISFGETLEITFTPELVKHINEIQVGYITAAYLTWFKEIGYNWVMQSSQELVRKQILECNYMLDGAKVIDIEGNELSEPAIGVILELGYVYPCCLMYDRVVIFPAPNGSTAPAPQTMLFSGKNKIHLLNLEIMNMPYSVSFEGGIAVLPDMLRKNLPIPEHLLQIYAEIGMEAEWLTLTK